MILTFENKKFLLELFHHILNMNRFCITMIPLNNAFDFSITKRYFLKVHNIYLDRGFKTTTFKKMSIKNGTLSRLRACFFHAHNSLIGTNAAGPKEAKLLD